MRKCLTLLLTAGALMGLTATSASADPGAINGHDCAGAIVSSLTPPGIGPLVSQLAHAQLVDNIGLADCGQTNRNNP